jgi:hypothetical protein
MKQTIACALLILAAACGGPEAQPTNSQTPPEKFSAPHVSTGVRCSNMDWQDIFWSDATHTVQVGTLTCSCFQLEDLEGVESPYITLAYEDTCDLR